MTLRKSDFDRVPKCPFCNRCVCQMGIEISNLASLDKSILHRHIRYILSFGGTEEQYNLHSDDESFLRDLDLDREAARNSSDPCPQVRVDRDCERDLVSCRDSKSWSALVLSAW